MDHHDNASEIGLSQIPSRATSPGGWGEDRAGKGVIVAGPTHGNTSRDLGDEQNNEDKMQRARQTRYRPRTFPYQQYLPYSTDNDQRWDNLETCIKRLYVAVAAGDFVPGATHWTREIRGWIQLKFDLPRQDRIKLAKLYYELALAPGMEGSAADRFASMFMTLTKYVQPTSSPTRATTDNTRRKHYLKPGEDLYLDWRSLYREFKSQVLPSDSSSVATVTGVHSKRSSRTLLKISSFAQLYFDPEEIPNIFDEVLPYFNTSTPEHAFAVVGILNVLLPTGPPSAQSKWQIQHYLPSIFHLWSLVSRSKTFDQHSIDLISRLARDNLISDHAQFSEYGLFTGEQAALIFTAILRLLEIPVSQVTSPYSPTVDLYAGSSVVLERDARKHPVTHHIARWIVMSLSPICLEAEDSVLSKLEGLISAVETFFHPSNTGAWTKTLSQLVFYLADFFVMRWNREQSGEMLTPKDRRLNEAVRRRFVLCLRGVTFTGIFAKSGTAISYALSALQSLAYLEPTLILPGALQRFYPSLQGQVEVHRTTSSIRALHELTRVMAKVKGFRCHITSLLGLALPGIDANDLDKTLHTLAYMQAVFYEIPMHNLAMSPKHKSGDEDEMGSDHSVSGMLAGQWVTGEIERLSMQPIDTEIDYTTELSDTEETKIARSSTAEFATFITSLLDRIFNLLRNLPDANRMKSGSPEENVANTIPAMLTALFSSMSPELYDIALHKTADFISKHVVFQARDAMAFICSTLCKVDSKKALGVLVPILTRAIRTEIEDNGAGSTRTTGSDILPRDQALVWNMSLLSMSLVHVGSAVMDFKEELLRISQYMLQRCKGIPSTHASNCVHHILLTLTMTYTVDYSLYEESDVQDGITLKNWGYTPDSRNLNIKWHYPDISEIGFAVQMFQTFAEAELEKLEQMTSDNSPIKRDGTGKEWSDEVSRSLVLLRLMVSSVSSLFDPRNDLADQQRRGSLHDEVMTDPDNEINGTDMNAELNLDATEDEDIKPSFQYPTGYQLSPGEHHYQVLHDLRKRIGEMFHKLHDFLSEKQQDDVTAFNALYTGYRSWFTDVGIERSAHTLDRMTRLLIADVGPFKISGLRKEYPRPLLVRRANVYHLQRLRHNASPRRMTALDETLLHDLVQSSVSYYTDIRRTAQTAIESTMKVVIGARPSVIPTLLDHFASAVKTSDFPRIKGAMYTLLFGSLTRPVGRNWKYTPSLMKSYIEVMDVDKPSVQKLATAASLHMMDMTRQASRMVILDKTIVDGLAAAEYRTEPRIKARIDKQARVIQNRQSFGRRRRAELAEELAIVAKKSSWKKESRTATLVIGLSLRFDDIASTTMIDLVVKKSIDAHPTLRTIYNSALIGIFAYVEIRALAGHDLESLLLERKSVPALIRQIPERDDPAWTARYLKGFGQAEADVYVDMDYPGWLVWGDSFPAFQASVGGALNYDDVESNVRIRIGKLLDETWFASYFDYMKQEPRDQAHDRFHMTNVITLNSSFALMFSGLTPMTFEQLKDRIKLVYGDGSDKHQHRATAEIFAALFNTATHLDVQKRSEVWEFAFPLVRNILEDGITPDNSSYWSTFLDIVLQTKDPRRNWPLVEWLSSFRLDITSNAAFKESSKITLLEHCILDNGWRFQMEKPILEDFLAHLDHPYKGVREVMGQTLAYIFRTRHHESHQDVNTFIEHEKSKSSVGSKPYQPSEELTHTMKTVFDRLEVWRKERPAGLQTASPYTSGSKTVLSWMESSLHSFECIQLIPFFPDMLLEALLHMMDIKEDQELQAYAYAAFRHLGNIPFRRGEEQPFVEALIRIGKTAASWHQRLRILINIQAIYFRHLFLMPRERQQAMFDHVAEQLQDTQLEVRVGAATTLSGMIRCSSEELRTSVIDALTKKFSDYLANNPLPRRKAPGAQTGEQSKLVIGRHAAVLGLGALVEAFPYTSPPPLWIPGILATLASKAAGDPGMVGKSAKSIVSDFRKTRQDTWHNDERVRSLLYAC